MVHKHGFQIGICVEENLMISVIHMRAVMEDRQRELKVHMEHNRIYFNNRDLLEQHQSDTENGLRHLILWLSTIWRRIFSADWIHGQGNLEVFDWFSKHYYIVWPIPDVMFYDLSPGNRKCKDLDYYHQSRGKFLPTMTPDHYSSRSSDGLLAVQE